MKPILLGALLALMVQSVAPAQAATTYTYDTLGRIATATYDNGTVVTYTYDPAGNRTQVVTATH